MGECRFRTCSVCGTRYWSSGPDYRFTRCVANFCPECQQDLEQVINPASEYDRQINNLYDALSGYRDIVINRCQGGFGLSFEARIRYLETLHIDYTLHDRESRESTRILGRVIHVNGRLWSEDHISRDDPVLVQIVREMGEAAAGHWSVLKIVSIPADVAWEIASYTGMEVVRECHRTWV